MNVHYFIYLLLKYNIFLLLSFLILNDAKADTWERIKSRGTIQLCLIHCKLLHVKRTDAPYNIDAHSN